MYRKLAALVLAAALLCSCSARVTVQRYPAELPQVESPAATPTPEPVPTFTEEQKSYGSAALLTDATVLVNVFLNDAAHGHTWDAESRAAAVQRTQLAVDWITEQAAGYEAAVNLICDRSADGSDSTLTRSYLVQSAMQGGENSEESSAFLDEMDTLCASLAADSRLAAYGARHIAFLFFLPISGTSFTMAHYADDGDSFYHGGMCCGGMVGNLREDKIRLYQHLLSAYQALVNSDGGKSGAYYIGKSGLIVVGTFGYVNR